MAADPQHISQRQLRNDSGAVLRAVEAGATYVITNNGRPVARLTPITQDIASLFPGRRVTPPRPGASIRDIVPIDTGSDESTLDVLLEMRGDR